VEDISITFLLLSHSLYCAQKRCG